jgi:hypothetical protein
MTATFRWIGSLPSVLQSGLDRAVSAELHSITANIRRSKIAGHAAAAISVGDLTEADAADAGSAAPGKMAA